eukprot:365896-Chlamydomonas_euryale.AAC.4
MLVCQWEASAVGTEALGMPWHLKNPQCNDDDPGQSRCRDHRRSKPCQLECALDWRGSALGQAPCPAIAAASMPRLASFITDISPRGLAPWCCDSDSMPRNGAKARCGTADGSWPPESGYNSGQTASASRMDQTGSTRSYPTSTTARCRKDRNAQGPEKDRTKQRKLKEKNGLCWL